MVEETPLSRKSAVGNLLCLLDYLSSLRRGASVVQIGDALGLSRSQAHRIVKSLTAEGVLSRHPRSGSVIFGPRMAGIALRLLGGSSIRPLWHTVLTTLVDEVGATCNLVVYDRCVGTYFDRIEINWPLPVQFRVGSTIPLHCTVGGKLYLAMLPRAEREAVLDALPLNPFTARTHTERNIFEQHLATVAAQGYAINEGEFFPDLAAVGVPVCDADNRLVATLGMQAPLARLSLADAQDQVPRLQRAAAQLMAVFDAQDG
ncbi:MAG TPA: IclR family transcriptional regulator [Acidocella sp.]|jgi:IclR family acetate operon transcriptional repressor|uniref:IclR family transcriptional regulator n=1 Tax=Acidocella sp. TaxID=50710 RepID=UPI002B9A4E42|nr:IclR family transcriptional regulator [Acidocella sp.]HVE22177.1 IclR family transcriptional regulator [Acidocella sp.]